MTQLRPDAVFFALLRLAVRGLGTGPGRGRGRGCRAWRARVFVGENVGCGDSVCCDLRCLVASVDDIDRGVCCQHSGFIKYRPYNTYNMIVHVYLSTFLVHESVYLFGHGV